MIPSSTAPHFFSILANDLVHKFHSTKRPDMGQERTLVQVELYFGNYFIHFFNNSDYPTFCVPSLEKLYHNVVKVQRL